MFFFVITKNLNREISTKNLVTFKRWEGGEWCLVFLGGGRWYPNDANYDVRSSTKISNFLPHYSD